jgi:hypothetical protein
MVCPPAMFAGVYILLCCCVCGSYYPKSYATIFSTYYIILRFRMIYNLLEEDIAENDIDKEIAENVMKRLEFLRELSYMDSSNMIRSKRRKQK